MSIWSKLRGWFRPPPPAGPDPRLQLLHWSPDRLGLAWCGARRGARWTIELDYVTCEQCAREGRLLQNQWNCNTR